MPESFAYQAQTAQGQPLSGTIDAADAEQATRLLQSLRLRVLEIAPVTAPAPRPGALRGDDFLAFNQQLMHLARAGVPAGGPVRAWGRHDLPGADRHPALRAAFSEHRPAPATHHAFPADRAEMDAGDRRFAPDHSPGAADCLAGVALAARRPGG